MKILELVVMLTMQASLIQVGSVEGWSMGKPFKVITNLFHHKGEPKKAILHEKGSEKLTHLKGSNRGPLSLTEAVTRLNEIAPLSLGEPWDNVGLLVEPPTARPIKTIFLTNDLTIPVLEEALNASADMIVAYHPPIFKSINKITTDSWKEKILGTCLESGIAVYSPHTCWDSMSGGTADWLASAFHPAKVEPLIPPEQSVDENKKVQYLVEVRGAKNLGSGIHTKTLLENGGSKITYSNPKESRLIIKTSSEKLPLTLKTISKTFVGSSSTIKLEDSKNDGGLGVGRFVTLNKPTPIKDLVDLVKQHLDRPHLQLALSFSHELDQKVTKIALVPGSGGSVLLNTAYAADVFLTGEMSHHELLDATNQNVSVILAEHSNTERGFLKEMAKRLTSDFSAWQETKVIVSKTDKDPLVVV